MIILITCSLKNNIAKIIRPNNEANTNKNPYKEIYMSPKIGY